MLKLYCEENIETSREYEQLMIIVEKLNTVVDIWNYPSSKTFKCEPNGERYNQICSLNGEYVEYLEDVLIVFTEWYEESKAEKKPYNFMPKILYGSFAWLVYRLECVSMQIADGCSMVQC